MSSPKSNKLTSRQVRFLRGLGHHLHADVMVGREGVTAPVLAALDASLTAHELVKVKVQQNCPVGRKEVAHDLAMGSGSQPVQVLGRTILLFRANLDLPADRRLQLP